MSDPETSCFANGLRSLASPTKVWPRHTFAQGRSEIELVGEIAKTSLLAANEDDIVNLRQLGCTASRFDAAQVTFASARNPPAFNWYGAITAYVGIALALTLLAATLVYGFVRAIGWVIGGFAAS